MQQLHITEVKADGLASAKGIYYCFYEQTNMVHNHMNNAAVKPGSSNNGVYVCGQQLTWETLDPTCLFISRSARVAKFAFYERGREKQSETERERKSEPCCEMCWLAGWWKEGKATHSLVECTPSCHMLPFSVFTILLTKKYSPWRDQPPTSVCPHDVNLKNRLKHLKTSGRLH